MSLSRSEKTAPARKMSKHILKPYPQDLFHFINIQGANRKEASDNPKNPKSISPVRLVDEEQIRHALGHTPEAWTTLHATADFSHLTILRLDRLGLVVIPQLMRLYGLKDLSLDCNNIATIAPNRLPHKLEKISLRYNNLCDASRPMHGKVRLW